MFLCEQVFARLRIAQSHGIVVLRRSPLKLEDLVPFGSHMSLNIWVPFRSGHLVFRLY